jgi:hypothetical protein
VKGGFVRLQLGNQFLGKAEGGFLTSAPTSVGEPRDYWRHSSSSGFLSSSEFLASQGKSTFEQA